MDQGTQRLIRRHNAQMRDLIVRDIDALENKLNVRRQVSHLADDAVDKVKGTLGMNQEHSRDGLVGFVRHNAVPLLAVGLGGTVLARNLRGRVGANDRPLATFAPGSGTEVDSSSRPLQGATATMADASHAVGGKVADAGQVVGEKAALATGKVAEQAAAAKEVVVERLPSGRQAQRMAEDHGQLLGLAALAAGAVAGSFTPRTRIEEQRLAPVQAQVKEKATEVMQDSVEQAKQTAERAAEAISAGAEAAKDEFSDSADGNQRPDDAGAAGMPDLTQKNRITGSRTTTPSGVDGGGY